MLRYLKYCLVLLLLFALGLGSYWGRGNSGVRGVEMVLKEPQSVVEDRAPEDLVSIDVEQPVVRVPASGRVEFVPVVRAGLDDGNSFKVQVQDRSGRILPGYPLRICRKKAGVGFERAGPLDTHFALTDDSGVARFGLDAVAELNGKGFVLSGLSWRADAYLALTKFRLGQGLVQFTVSNLGALGVKLVDAKGFEWTGRERLYAEGEGWRRYAMLGRGGWYWMHDLPVGVRFDYYVVNPGSDRRVGRRCDPLMAGDTARRLELRRADLLLRAKGVVRDSDGQLLRNREVSVRYEGSRKSAVPTDETGEIELTFTQNGVAGIEVLLAGSRSEVQSDSGEWLNIRSTDEGAWVAVGEFETGQVQDLGTITLEKNPGLVSGEVWIDGSSQAVQGEVKVYSFGARPMRPRALGGSEGSVNPKPIARASIGRRAISRGDSREELIDLFISDSDRDSAGHHFAINGIYQNQRIRLEITATGAEDGERYVPNGMVETTVGTRDLKIELVRAVKIEGLIQAASMDTLGPTAEERSLEALFRYRDGRERRLLVDRFGNIRGTVPPGLADVSIVRARKTDRLALLPSVHIDQRGSHEPIMNSIVLD